MKKALLAILPLFLLLPNAVFGDDLLVVMDAERPHYQQVLQGFMSVCACGTAPPGGVKSIQPVTLHRLILDDKNEEAITASIRNVRPDLILAIGNRSLQAAMRVPEVPIVYLLVANPQRLVGKRENITGIELRLPADRQFEAIRKHLPTVKRLGVIYDPARTGNLVAEANIAAPRHLLSLVASPVNGRSDIAKQLTTLRTARIEGIWMLPDITVLEPTILQDLLLFSLENKIPLISFADRYLQAGAAVSITFDMTSIGAEAGKMANAILGGTPIAAIPPRPAQRATVKHNPLIVKKLGVIFIENGQTGVGK
ncbi:MAG: hypothetical protein OEV73_04130 [Desulfobulbaceae bacterium]|nr:hypothetical protein [Desulfobulbaceae bacterium]